LLRKDPLNSTSKSASAEILGLDESGRAWLSAMQKDQAAQAHIRGLVSKLVAEFVKVECMDIATISEVVILGPVLCRVEYRTLLSCFIQRFDQTPLLNVDMLQGMVQLVQSASPGYLEDDDLVRILVSFRMRLESTHAPSRAHVYRLVFAVSKVLEVMVAGEIKGPIRQCDHESLLAVLRGLRGMRDDVLLEFQVDYAHQTLLYLVDDGTSWQAFLRHAESIAVEVSAVACVFKLDLMNALTAVKGLHQVAGNAIDVVKFNINGTPAFQATAESAAQAGGIVYWPNKKESWFLTLQTAYVFVRQGRLVEFNKLVCEAGCRFDINFQRGVCQLLGEIAGNQLWDIASRQSAIDFLGALYKVEADRKKDVKIQKCVVSILSRVSRMSWPGVSVPASSLLADFQEDKIADTEIDHPLHTCLTQPDSFPLLDRVLNISEVEYDLDRMKFQRLQEHLLPNFVPLHAKATLATSDSDSFPLMQRVLEFLESDRQVFLLLGDSGSGKSQFCRQLERILWEQYDIGRRIPLFIDLPFIDRPDNDLIGKHLRDHNIPAHKVQEIKQHRHLVLICDGYDECGITTNLHTANKLNRAGQHNVKIVISCRTTFFGRDYQSQFYPHGADKYHDSPSHMFEEATIVPFTEDDIKAYTQQYIRNTANQNPANNRPHWTVEQFMDTFSTVPNLSDLVKNPFVLWLALRVLPSLSSDALISESNIRVTRARLYDGFLEDWICVNKSRIERIKLTRKASDVFRDLCESEGGFKGCVTDFLTDLSAAMFEHQGRSTVVDYVHVKEEKTWKGDFFGRKIKSTLLRQASPLKRSGAQFRFIDDSFLAYLRSLIFYNPDQGGDDSSENSEDDGSDDSQGDDSDNSEGDDIDNSEGDESDDGDEGDSESTEIDDSGEGADDDEGDVGGILHLSDFGLTDEGGGSPGGNYDASEGNAGSFGGNERIPGRNKGSANKSDGSSAGNDDLPGGNDNAANGERGSNNGMSGSPGGSGGSGGNGNNSSGDRDGSKEDKSNPRQGKNGSRSKKKGRSTKHRLATSNDPFSKHNVFKDPQVLEFLVDRVHSDLRFEKCLLCIIEHSKSSAGPSLAAANSMTILYMAGERFGDIDLDGVQIPFDYMLEEGSDTLQQSRCLTGADFVGALSALGVTVPIHFRMSARLPQPAPHTLLGLYPSIGTEPPTLYPSTKRESSVPVKARHHIDNALEKASPLRTLFPYTTKKKAREDFGLAGGIARVVIGSSIPTLTLGISHHNMSNFLSPHQSSGSKSPSRAFLQRKSWCRRHQSLEKEIEPDLKDGHEEELFDFSSEVKRQPLLSGPSSPPLSLR
ncbi:WD_REPEATS_REGION domain-containing protein, partial [Mortierella sp. AD032]